MDAQTPESAPRVNANAAPQHNKFAHRPPLAERWEITAAGRRALQERRAAVETDYERPLGASRPDLAAALERVVDVDSSLASGRLVGRGEKVLRFRLAGAAGTDTIAGHVNNARQILQLELENERNWSPSSEDAGALMQSLFAAVKRLELAAELLERKSGA